MQRWLTPKLPIRTTLLAALLALPTTPLLAGGEEPAHQSALVTAAPASAAPVIESETSSAAQTLSSASSAQQGTQKAAENITPINTEPAQPEPTGFDQLLPFKASYQAQFDLGLSVNGEAVRELKQDADGQWLLSMRASAMMANFDETSRFEIQRQQLRPQHYSYLRKVFTKKKQIDHRFDWRNGQLEATVKGNQTQLPLKSHTFDKVSIQLQLWNDIKAGATEVNYWVSDGDRIKAYEFDRLGEEVIDTPAGKFDTIKVARDRGDASARKTYIWFAKAHDHVIVKLQQVEPDGKQYTLMLEQLDSSQ